MRNRYIDILKGILITLVVIGHLNFFEYNSRTATLIYSLHMHAFLIIGGYLSHIDENSSFLGIISKRIRKTLVPYFVFYIISLIFMPIEPPNTKIQAVITIFKGIGDPNTALNLPLWFLTFYFMALTIYELIECLFYKVFSLIFNKNKEKYKFLKIFLIKLAVLAIIAIFMQKSYIYAKINHNPRIPFNTEIACFCLGFVYFGNIIKIFVNKIKKILSYDTLLTTLAFIVSNIIILMIIIIWYMLSMDNGRIDLNARDYKDAFYMYVDAILGFCILAYVSFLINYMPIIRNIFSVFGRNSLYILAYHVPSVTIIYNIIFPLLPLNIQNYLSINSIISVLVISCLEILISLFFAMLHKITKLKF